jgi:hypothetical protein
MLIILAEETDPCDDIHIDFEGANRENTSRSAFTAVMAAPPARAFRQTDCESGRLRLSPREINWAFHRT